ncbi:MAG: DUF3078 domain-containing protein [Flavobacteriales bacterium]
MKHVIAIALLLCSTFSWAQDANNKVLTPEEETMLVKTLTTPVDSLAADTTWKKGGTLGLNFSQVYLSNWAAGGQNSLSSNGLVSLFANRAKGKSSWDNTLDLAYGMLWQGDAVGVKTDDKIDFASKWGYQANQDWFYSVLFNFRTQFAPGYEDPFADDLVRISDFLAPAFSLAALGMDYKPSDNFTAFISPSTLKMTIVNDTTLSTNYGVAAGEMFRAEIGGYAKVQYTTELAENVSLMTKIDLFSNYLNNPQNIDVNWETLISMKINEYMSATISTQLIYDDDIAIARSQEYFESTGIAAGPITQFKEVLAVGFSYKL